MKASRHRESLARHTGNAPRLIEAMRPVARQARLRSTPLDAAHLHANTTQRHKPSRETLAAFACTARAIEVSRDLSWPSADALTRIACCGRLRSASRAAQPSSSAVRAVFFAMWSWTVCGDATRRIKPSCLVCSGLNFMASGKSLRQRNSVNVAHTIKCRHHKRFVRCTILLCFAQKLSMVPFDGDAPRSTGELQ